MKRISIISYSLLIFMLFSCSTEKNTPLSVAYHNMTAHYNVHFNGYESFEKGLLKLYANHDDDYNAILPIYVTVNEATAGSIAPEMDRVQKKAMKAIEMHSIKAKPEYKSDDLSSKQRDYLQKNEYNKWVDNCYMLIGKSYFYQMSHNLAMETFRFVLREFENEPVVYEAKLWMAMASIELEEYKEALNFLSDLDAEKKADEHLKAQMNAVYAQYFVLTEDYTNAIARLKKALKKPGDKKTKMRYTYVLAQLYQQTQKNKQAYDTYRKLIKMNPPYEMTFNAKINMAGAFELGHGNVHNIADELRKMLKDDKNIDFKDQIYYALGNIYLKEGKEEEAIEYYKLSSIYSVSNTKQKAKTFLTLADYYYEVPEYILAQSYYDSTFVLLDPQYPDYDLIEAKSKNLTELVENIHAVELQDSVQILARLTNAERYNIIDQIIADLAKKERELQLKEQERAQELQMARMNNPTNNATGQAGTWYFYNITAKSYGIKEFQTKWGNRKLEDNWRRKNKSIMSTDQLTTSGDTEDESKQTTAELSNKSREYYLRNIPLTDSAMLKSHETIKESLVNIGLIYKNQFNETELSIKAFEDLIARYPNDPVTLTGYYNLYIIYREDNPSKAETYKNIIVSKYPDSKFAKVLTDPEYFKEIERQEKEGPLFYEQTLDLFNNENYVRVVQNADIALVKYKNTDLIPKFKYLKTMSFGKTSDTETFRKALEEFIKDPENKELAGRARIVLNYLDNERPEIKEKQEAELAWEIYNIAPDQNHYLVVMINANANLDQLAFNVINFNLDNYDQLNLNVEKATLSAQYKMVQVGMFNGQDEVMKYYNGILENANSILVDVNAREHDIFFISMENIRTLKQDGNINRYQIFFNANFK